MITLKDIVTTSSLEPQEIEKLIVDFSPYEQVAEEWKEKAYQIRVTSRSQTTEMEMAKVAVKKFSDMRLKIEKSRKSLKESALRRGQAIDAIARYLQSLISPIEEHLKAQADFIKLDDARIAFEAEQSKLKEEEEKLKKAEEEARREQERIRLENEELKKKLEAERIEREKIEAVARQKEDLLRAEREKIEKEKREKEANEAKAIQQEKEAKSKARYTNWLTENKFDSATMKVERQVDRFLMYQLVATLEVEITK